ncbi:hypothetical protein GIB67_021173 [Kingdonia uniflora]|uniref:Transposase n=1 Tax=Kingdonia uniflora TaxID=39325 RepID=A0A7J7N7M5_9MAGN|nr:hypothetical protein GIB67_021173 [Kingdonia uniflora]
MSSVNLNKNWRKESKLTYDFLNSVQSFIDYVKQTLGDMAYCPYNKCRNVNGVKTVDEIRTHLITYGIDQSYTTWYFHEESRDATIDARIQNPGSVEGCIANRYVLDEAILYCMEYIPNGKKGTHKRGRPTFMDDNSDKEQPLDKGNVIHLETLKKYDIYLRDYMRVSRLRGSTNVGKPLDYILWLREQFENSEMSTLERLVNGPSFKVTSYKAYRVNGFVFCTADSESLFYCDWVRVEDKVNGCAFDAEANLTFVNLQNLKKNSKVDDEPYCLASQASQVFYCQDPTRTDWSVVIDVPKRLVKDIDAYEEPLVFETGNPFTSSMMGLINENVDEDEEITEGSWM